MEYLAALRAPRTPRCRSTWNSELVVALSVSQHTVTHHRHSLAVISSIFINFSNFISYSGTIWRILTISEFSVTPGSKPVQNPVTGARFSVITDDKTAQTDDNF